MTLWFFIWQTLLQPSKLLEQSFQFEFFNWNKFCTRSIGNCCVCWDVGYLFFGKGFTAERKICFVCCENNFKKNCQSKIPWLQGWALKPLFYEHEHCCLCEKVMSHWRHFTFLFVSQPTGFVSQTRQCCKWQRWHNLGNQWIPNWFDINFFLVVVLFVCMCKKCGKNSVLSLEI